jgi:3-deoxy-D-manno-octulosonic acid (KDO) 8-phosphate synthase
VLFIKNRPDHTPASGPNMLGLEDFTDLLPQMTQIDRIVRAENNEIERTPIEGYRLLISLVNST